MNAQIAETVMELRAQGVSWRRIEAAVGVSAAAIRREMKPGGREQFRAYARDYMRRSRQPGFQKKQVHVLVVRPKAMREIVAATAQHFKVGERDLLGRCQVPRIALARHVAFYLMRTDAVVSFPAIGRLMDRDHSTVIHGVSRIATMIEAGDPIAADVEAVRAMLSKTGAAG